MGCHSSIGGDHSRFGSGFRFMCGSQGPRRVRGEKTWLPTSGFFQAFGVED